VVSEVDDIKGITSLSDPVLRAEGAGGGIREMISEGRVDIILQVEENNELLREISDLKYPGTRLFAPDTMRFFVDLFKGRDPEWAVSLDSGAIYKTIFDLSPEAIVLLDIKGNVVTCNNRIFDWLGYSPEEIKGKNIISLPFIPPRSKPRIIAKFTQRLLGKQVLPYEADFTHKNGNTRVGMLYATPVRDEYDKIVGDLVLADDITERKMAQKALSDSEERYRNVVERANDGICIIDGSEIIFTNRKFALLVGADREEIVHSHIHEHIHPEEIPFFREKYSEHLSGKRDMTSFDTALSGVSGEKVDIEISASFFIYKGETRTLLFVRDITERKKAETRLREFKTISDKANYGVFIADLGSRFTYVNEAFARMHGYAPSDLIGQQKGMLYNRDQAPKAAAIDDQIFSKGGVYGKELWHVRKDGAVFPILLSGVLIKDDDGAPLFEAATAIDITENKIAQHRLIESEERFRTLIENLNVGVYRITGGEKGRFIQINPAMARIFGFPDVSELSKMSLVDLFEDPREMFDFLKLMITYGHTKNKEFRMRKKGGGNILVSCSATAQYDEEGNIKWVDGVFEDITERKEAETELAHQRYELDEMNRELKRKVSELEAAFNHIKRLEGLMPICANCKKMLVEGRDPKDDKAWVPFEEFISERTDASFTHGLCPECVKNMYSNIKRNKRSEE
jgi:PAS domain S-box-containing protein